MGAVKGPNDGNLTKGLQQRNKYVAHYFLATSPKVPLNKLGVFVVPSKTLNIARSLFLRIDKRKENKRMWLALIALINDPIYRKPAIVL